MLLAKHAKRNCVERLIIVFILTMAFNQEKTNHVFDLTVCTRTTFYMTANVV